MKEVCRVSLVAVLILISGRASGGAGMDPASYMAKVSERLVGSWPTPEEYSALSDEMNRTRCQAVSCLDAFFRAYIETKMNAREFYSEATLKVFERFAFQTPRYPFFSDNGSGSSTDSLEQLLVYRIFRDDASIDDLYVSQVVPNLKQTGETPESRSYIERIIGVIETAGPARATVLEAGRYPLIPHNLLTMDDHSGHPNVAGLFSMKRYLTRYWNEPVNEGRKRAAGLFRIMLCDSMAPALERSTMRQREEALARGAVEGPMTQRAIEDLHRDRHASQRDCAACHNRLDPVARSMRPLELGVSLTAIPGRLRINGGLFDRPAPNFHSLVKLATETSKYADCQLNWLSTWIIGRDVRIHPARFAELAAEFERTGRKSKTAISMLLRSPEFRGEAPSFVEPPSFTRAQTVLQNCEECHAPVLAMRGDELKSRLAQIASRLDLPHGGARRTMPPAYHYWSPSAGDLQTVAEWIRDGAPTAQGRPPILSEFESRRLLAPPAQPNSARTSPQRERRR